MRHLPWWLATSADTLLRLVRTLPPPAAPTPTALGLDDWAFKRGNTYGTLLVDLENRRAVDLLPDRRAETLAAWLRPRRHKIRVVARDRSSEFERGVNLGAPRAVQVADRWHLLQNTREMLTRWLFGMYGRLRRLPSTVLASSPRKGVRTRAFPRARTMQAACAASRARSLARYQEVRRRHVAGESLRAIKKATGLARATVRRFARAGTCHVERWNCTLRQRLGRFVRKTLSFSKCDRMHTLALRLFIHHYN